MKNRLTVFLLALIFGIFTMHTACAGVMNGDVIRIGTEATYPPFEFRNEKNEIVGYEIEAALEIAEILGKKAEVVDMAFDGLIPALLTGKVDLLAAGMTNTEERRKKVDFSIVYYDLENAFVVRNDDDSMTELDHLRGKVASVQMGTTQDIFITGSGLPAEIKRFQKNDDALMELKYGRADFSVINLTVAGAYLKDNRNFTGSLKIAFKSKLHREGEGIAMALPKGDEAFLKAVNDAISSMKEKGRFDELKKKYGMD